MCGYLGHYSGRCRCTPDQILRYRSRISGPLLDRIDIQIEVPAVTVDDLARAQPGESSAAIRERVERARALMRTRQEKANAKLTSAEVERYCVLDNHAAAILQRAITKLALSARGYHRILKVARTIADLTAEERIAPAHVAEAIQYRRLDRSSL
jgi:magnesium chelatase family protein